MTKLQSQVEEFHIKHQLPVRTIPVHLPTPTEQILRISLITEELAEYAIALTNNDIPGMIDAIGDLLYVTYGAAITLGVDMEPIMDEIHKSNMTKDVNKDVKSADYQPPSILSLLKEQGY